MWLSILITLVKIMREENDTRQHFQITINCLGLQDSKHSVSWRIKVQKFERRYRLVKGNKTRDSHMEEGLSPLKQWWGGRFSSKGSNQVDSVIFHWKSFTFGGKKVFECLINRK